MALKALMLAEHVAPARVRFLDKVRTGPKGTSLAELAALAKTADFALEPVFRKPGEKVPVPSVVHWKVGHFSAIVAKRNGWFEIEDRSLAQHSEWVTQAALDAEASGYFLAPAKEARPVEWRRVAASEAGRVWGAGPIEDIIVFLFGGCQSCGCQTPAPAIAPAPAITPAPAPVPAIAPAPAPALTLGCAVPALLI